MSYTLIIDSGHKITLEAYVTLITNPNLRCILQSWNSLPISTRNLSRLINNQKCLKDKEEITQQIDEKINSNLSEIDRKRYDATINLVGKIKDMTKNYIKKENNPLAYIQIR